MSGETGIEQTITFNEPVTSSDSDELTQDVHWNSCGTAARRTTTGPPLSHNSNDSIMTVDAERKTNPNGFTDGVQDDLEKSKAAFIVFVGRNVEWLKRRTALLTLKYSSLKWIHDAISISAIAVSTFLTILETIKAELDIRQNPNVQLKQTFVLLPIFFSSYIGLALSILRFKRLQERLEDVLKITEKAVYVTSRLRRVQHDALSALDVEALRKVQVAYSSEIFSLYNDVKAAIDRNLKFEEILMYKRKYKDMLEDAATMHENNEIHLQGGTRPARKSCCACVIC